jgi:hypothetical protein
VVRSDKQKVSEEKALQKNVSDVGRMNIHVCAELALLLDPQQKVGEFVLSITSCPSILFKKILQISRRHRHHHVAIKELDHLLTSPGLTHPEVSSVVFLGSFCLLGCSSFISLGNLLRGIRFICCIHFL